MITLNGQDDTGIVQAQSIVCLHGAIAQSSNEATHWVASVESWVESLVTIQSVRW